MLRKPASAGGGVPLEDIVEGVSSDGMPKPAAGPKVKPKAAAGEKAVTEGAAGADLTSDPAGLTPPPVQKATRKAKAAKAPKPAPAPVATAVPAPAPGEEQPPGPSDIAWLGIPAAVSEFKTNLDAMKPPAVKAVPRPGVPTTLPQAVLKAVSDNALIKVSEGGAADALASIGVAAAGLYPQIEGRMASGPAGTGDWEQTHTRPLFDNKKAYGAMRLDATMSGQQIIYDFGATKAGVSRAAANTQAQNYTVLQTIEDVAFRTADAYLKVQQQRDLLDLSIDNVTALKEIADLVDQNQRNGNGTVADVKRVGARVVDATSAQADEELALKIATDQLRRLILMDPGKLSPAPSLDRALPPDEKKALSLALTRSPVILAYKSSIEAREYEIASIRNGTKPKVTADVTVSSRNWSAVNDKVQLDATGVLALVYKFADGGLASSQVEQARARMLQDEMRMRDASETIENDLRTNYFTLRIAKNKDKDLEEGVALNRNARSLYREQFKGGKRSLLELLEVQQSYYLSKRSQITNQFDARRASYQILRSLGTFAATAVQARS